jgi:hypothetical protein
LILGDKSRVKEHYDDFLEALILRLPQRNYSRALALGTDENETFYGFLQQPLIKGEKLKVPGARNGVHQGCLLQSLLT